MFQPVILKNVKKWIKTKSPSHITTVLSRLDNNSNIHRKKKENIITSKGIDYVEKKLLKDL